MIEAMACGTPVIAYRHGSVPEVMDDEVTGFVVDNLEEAVQAVERVPSLSRAECRRVFERRFSVRRMAQDYVAVYRRLVDEAVTDPTGRRPTRKAILLGDGQANGHRRTGGPNSRRYSKTGT
jgi:hypothetical protein